MKYDPATHPWTPWTVAELREVMAGHSGLWWLSGGMAVEHRVGRVVRSHGDIDVSVLRDGLPPLLDALGNRTEAWAAVDGHLARLAPGLDVTASRNVWLAAAGTTRFVLQVNVEDGDERAWTYARRPEIVLPWPDAVTEVDGVPTGSMATQLLWKSRDPRAVDDTDFDTGWPLLTGRDEDWLRGAVRWAHPDSPWIGTRV
jgi:hypothetical protein